MGTTTVEHITTTIATLILRNALGEGEAEHTHHQRSLRIILREGGRSILRVSLIRIKVGDLITVSTTTYRLYLGILRQLGELSEHIHQIWIVELRGACQQLAQVMDGGGYRLYKVLLLLVIASKAIGTQHLQGAEQHEKRQPVGEMAGRRHLNVVLQRVVILIHEFAPQLVGILGRSLPEK